MDIKQCKEIYEMLKKGKQFIANIDKDFFLSFAETVLAELEKKDKVINEMAKEIFECNEYIDNEFGRELNFKTKEQVIEYFTNKVERGGK